MAYVRCDLLPQVAVGAFKVVYAMYQTRTDNDAKITELHVEMRDMIVVLCQYVRRFYLLPITTNLNLHRLKGISKTDMTIVMPDGTEKHRLADISQQTAEDIRKCANCCDVYSKKRMLYKVLAGKQWEAQLGQFAGVFAGHKQEFLFALTVHTAAGIDKVGAQLSDAVRQQELAARRQAAMNAKYDATCTTLIDVRRAVLTRSAQDGRGAQKVCDARLT
jgi:hypothetical protein